MTDRALLELLNADPPRGWRAFIDQFTPAILSVLQRSGLRDRDEMMEVYTLVAERLAADQCARLRVRRQTGSLESWLAVVVRNVVVDWVRSRAGRRRLFGVVKDLSPFDQRVFELYYWERRQFAEIAGLLATSEGRDLTTADVLDAMGRINPVLTERHRSELLSTAVRSRGPEALESAEAGLLFEPSDPALSPEEAVIRDEQSARLERALAALPQEDAAIVRMHCEQLTLAQVRRALRLPGLSAERVAALIERVKHALREGRHDASHA